MRPQRFSIALVTMFCLTAFAAAQRSAPAGPKSKQPVPAPSASQSKETPAVADVTRVSTADAARKAAAEAARGHRSDAGSEASGTPEVLEFRPAESSSGAPTVSTSKQSRKPANVHGDVYGALGDHRAARQAGASAGGTSKSGKSSIYVQTDREATPAPR
jgi:hypothetical protein